MAPVGGLYIGAGELDIYLRATPASTDSVSSPMSADAPFNVYRDQLASLSLGIALWNPNPQKTIYNNVSIGDVGYLQEGTFIRMFNVMLPWGHPSNQTLGDPERFASLDCGRFHNTLDVNFNRVEHNSRFVSTETNADNIHARAPDE
jgi:hypothetical protein